MITLIKNATVITMDDTRDEQYEKLDIVIADDTIKELTNEYKGEYDKLIDATNKVVMPGLINCHTHLGMSVFRATNDSLTLEKWLQEKIWPIEDKLTDDDIYYTTMLSCIEMIKSGTTTSNDMYYNCKGSLKAIKECQVRSLFSRCLMDSDGGGDKRIEEFLKLYNENVSQDLITFSVAPHAIYTCSYEYLKRCANLAKELKLPIHIHFCENLDEVNNIKNKYHKSPLALLKELGYLENKLILAHATYISDLELEELKNRDVSFVHNPISNLNLGCGIADITKYRKYVNITLGTDGQGSGNNLNLFKHMSYVDLLQKGIYKDPTIFSSYDVLKIATINGAKALGLGNLVGSITPGKKADIIIIDLDSTETYPSPDLITNIVHNVDASNIDTTIVNGKILMENHQIKLSINEDNIKKEVDRIINKI
ncbi:MAG: amidohydrolase [Erysipelotrichaceae bacterium]|nr:amidohydrolase [Erysipelotrichaceae bacterium]